MSRLHRGLWQVCTVEANPLRPEPVREFPPLDHETAEVAMTLLTPPYRAVLIRLPGTVAAWESRAALRASDPPPWAT